MPRDALDSNKIVSSFNYVTKARKSREDEVKPKISARDKA